MTLCRRLMLAVACWFAIAPVGTLLHAAETARASSVDRPNIVFIFGDDSGIDSYGCYGSDRFKKMTPHLDALAAGGLRFDRCYSTPLCGPSRCLLMTGRHGFRTGGMSNGSASHPSFKDEPSMAKILKQGGYTTGMAGKWRQMSDSPGDWGFDEYITDPTASGYFWKKEYTKNGETVKHPNDIYYPDVTTDFAIDFMTRHREKPFYFYLSQHLIHGPILTTPDSKTGANASQLYDDNVVHLDKIVGRVVAALDKLGLRERTLIIYSADNGTSQVGYAAEHNPLGDIGKIGGRTIHGRKGQLLEGGSRVPLIANWQGTLSSGGTSNDLIDFSDLLPTFADLAGAKLPEGVKFDGRSLRNSSGRKGEPTGMDLRSTWPWLVCPRRWLEVERAG